MRPVSFSAKNLLSIIAMEKENELSSMRCEGTQFSFAMENNKIEWIVHPFQQALIQGSSQTPSDHKT
jgi:hypothetical protein